MARKCDGKYCGGSVGDYSCYMCKRTGRWGSGMAEKDQADGPALATRKDGTESLEMWLNIHPLAMSVCVPFKNGTTSMGRAIRTLLGLPDDRKIRRWKVADYTDQLSRTALPQYENAFLIVRHPEDRFKSLWRNKCRDRKSCDAGVAGLTPEGLLTAIQTQWDGHWAAQDEFRNGADCLPITIEAFAKFWTEVIGQPFPKLYTSEGDEPQLNEKQVELLRTLYAEDYKLWEERAYDLRVCR